MAGRYDDAIGFTSSHRVETTLSVQGFFRWTGRKMPALLGGHLADIAWTQGIKRLDKQVQVRGTDFVGGVVVFLSAYALQATLTKYRPASSDFLDRMTDGMVGRVSPELTRALVEWGKTLLPGNTANGRANGHANGACCDGDQQAMAEIAQLLYQSPEMTQDLAAKMIAAMKRDGIKFSGDGERLLAKSLREVSGQMAQVM